MTFRELRKKLGRWIAGGPPPFKWVCGHTYESHRRRYLKDIRIYIAKRERAVAVIHPDLHLAAGDSVDLSLTLEIRDGAGEVVSRGDYILLPATEVWSKLEVNK